MQNIRYESFLLNENILLPPLHIKLGLFKNFVKALFEHSEPMKILQETLPKLSKAKIKEGVFVDPYTRRLMKQLKIVWKTF